MSWAMSRARTSSWSVATPTARSFASLDWPANWFVTRGSHHPDAVWAEPARRLPFGESLRGQDPQGLPPGRPAGSASGEVRAGDQPQDREHARAHDHAVT